MSRLHKNISRWRTTGSSLGLALLLCILLGACKKGYLDIVPDNIATIDNAFTSTIEAEKFLFTCYSFLPKEGDPDSNPAFNAGDELWLYWEPVLDFFFKDPYRIARGQQNRSTVYMNYWDGFDSRSMWQGIRDCNIFLENIDRVRDLDLLLKDRWVKEVKFLKAYYHWYLFRMYGPIPLVDNNLPVESEVDAVKIMRQPVDSVVNFIAGLLDEASEGGEFEGLPSRILNQTDELGRVTKVAALSMKARLLVTAASALFNGNTDYINLKNKNGQVLFNPVFDQAKWVRAEEACRMAVEAAEAAGVKLHYQTAGAIVGEDAGTLTEMSIRNAVCQRWNSELIWGSTTSPASYAGQPTRWIQLFACPQLDATVQNTELKGQLAPTFKMAELFYSKNGVPINEDITYDYANRYKVKTATSADKNLQTGYQTAGLHFDREPRFYADMSFDGGKWFMRNNSSAQSPYNIQAKALQASGKKNTRLYSVTGYYTKKLVNWTLSFTANTLTVESYPWPVIRLADLYLLYAEALNENGKSSDALPYLNLIRARAGLNTVESSWGSFSSRPGKYTNVEGMRELIRQERGIELAFEGSRFWDLRRWKTAAEELNKPIYAWNINRESTTDYYQRILEFSQSFTAPRDYLWPLSETELQINTNLVQNTGW
ncbi:MAG: RagB/SusD family nutrient uptake outer membrane protein [Candidatus Pseudobacter hemicellulosilyticus]|uniref:RagB/SusD family nutrient uptake outer membrane protein n=1 Tax=Candidatus Pseudobacter hemicellulosilyticus TaxID=3121375 RepID=A0AAJ5WRF0_9BACT|nr:MAG: RagB/SusD family nutrient uptake outer membrane protein [Pseudobacter sp.]